VPWSLCHVYCDCIPVQHSVLNWLLLFLGGCLVKVGVAISNPGILASPKIVGLSIPNPGVSGLRNGKMASAVNTEVNDIQVCINTEVKRSKDG